VGQINGNIRETFLKFTQDKYNHCFDQIEVSQAMSVYRLRAEELSYIVVAGVVVPYVQRVRAMGATHVSNIAVNNEFHHNHNRFDFFRGENDLINYDHRITRPTVIIGACLLR